MSESKVFIKQCKYPDDTASIEILKCVSDVVGHMTVATWRMYVQSVFILHTCISIEYHG